MGAITTVEFEEKKAEISSNLNQPVQPQVIQQQQPSPAVVPVQMPVHLSAVQGYVPMPPQPVLAVVQGTYVAQQQPQQGAAVVMAQQ